MRIQNLSTSCIQIEVTKLQVLFDSKKPKLASPFTLLPWGGTHESNSEFCVSRDAGAVLSCLKRGIITSGAITRNSGCGVLNNGPVAMPTSSSYDVTLQGKRLFADMIKLNILRWEIILDLPDEISVITRALWETGRKVKEMRWWMAGSERCHC